jgi:cobalamin biosynthesis Mg chelatase CobN
VALQLKNLLANAEWAKQGLGESLIDRRTVSFSSLSDIPDDETNAIKVVKNNANQSTAVPVNVNPVSSFMQSTEWTTRTSHGNHQNHADNSIHESRLPLLSDDVDEDKYKSKSASEFLFRWFRNRRSLMKRPSVSSSSSNSISRYVFPGIIALVVLFTLVHFFLKFGRQSADADISLNPDFNPNIRNE